jgi:outer membrane protein assembly factor BamA
MMHSLAKSFVVAGLVAVAVPSARASDGTGDSPWGPIPAPADTSTAVAEDADTPAWETVVDVPFWVIMFPLKLLSLGAEAGTEWLDESGTLTRLSELYPIKIRNADLTFGLNAGGQDGLGANVNVDWHEFLGPGNRMRLGLSGYTRGKGSATLGTKFTRTERSWVEIGGGYRNNTNARYYGIGPNSSASRRSQYLEEVTWAGASYTRRPGAGFSWEFAATYSQVGAMSSDYSEQPRLSDEFADEIPVGYRNRSDGFSFALDLAHDNAVAPFPWGVQPERGRPERGGLRRVKAAYFQEKGDGNAQFWTYRGELQQFLPLWFDRRALALRGVVTYLDHAGGDEIIPFQRLVTNDDPDLFRGYVDYRFRDRGLVLATAEYRWPLWSMGQRNGVGVDGYVFGDWGQVFPEFDDINAGDMTTSYGGGLRLVGYGFFQGRIEFAWSEEDFVFRFRGDQVFQWAKDGLLNGRNPVPER